MASALHANLQRLVRAVDHAGACLAIALLAAAALIGSVDRAIGQSPGAASIAVTEHVRVELLAERNVVVAGERVTIALRQTIQPGWHTYWRNPGDSGLPTQLTWVAPVGLQAGAIEWPTPSRFPVGPLVNYGYANSVVLLATVTVPADSKSGASLDLTVDAAWLVCAEICIPEESRLSLSMQIGPRNAPSAAASAIEKARLALPQPSPWPARLALDRTRMAMQIDVAGLDMATLRDAYFFADDPGAVDHAAPQRVAVNSSAIVLDLAPGEARRGKAVTPLSGILALSLRTEAGDVTRAFALTAAPGSISATAVTALSAAGDALPIWQVVAFALLGGLILNFMPCVFPVLSMKAVAIIARARSDRRAAIQDGLAYLAGVLVCFAAIAATLLALRASGAELGWGFQFQSPIFVTLLAYVMLAVGLSLSGLFLIDAPALTNLGQARTRDAGSLGTFMTGLLAVVVATPCTAPFMGAALGVALGAEPLVMVAILFALGIGFAAPFVAVTLIPGIARLLPRPGAWMERLKQALAFPMYATAAWLVWVTSQQTSTDGFALVLGGCVIVGLAGWLYGQQQRAGSKFLAIASGASLVLALALAIGVTEAPVTRASTAQSPNMLGAETFTSERLQTLRGDGRTIFINMTAAWCITCLLNERATLASDAVRQAFERQHVVYLKGDWTQRDAAITQFLRSFQRSGVPLYVVYPGDGGTPIVLPQILTERAVLAAIDVPG